MVKYPILPDYPKAVLEEGAVVIQYENGEREVWGYEPNVKLGFEVAKDIEIGLKAIDYVAIALMNKLIEISDDLEALDIPENYKYEYIMEGYSKISKWFMKLESHEPTK